MTIPCNKNINHFLIRNILTEKFYNSFYLSGSIYPLGWKCPSRWKVTVGSIYPLGWKCPSGPFTLQVPFTLRDGSAHRVHLPFRIEMPFGFHLNPSRWKNLSAPFIHLSFKMEMPIRFTDPSGFIYPSGWKIPIRSIYHSVSIYHSSWKVPVRSIYPSGWKCPSGSIYSSGWKYPTGPFTLRDGSTH